MDNAVAEPKPAATPANEPLCGPGVPRSPACDHSHDLEMKGRFAPYESPFLKLFLPLLSTRYLWLAIREVNPLNILGKPDPKKTYTKYRKPTWGQYIRSKNFPALAMGTTLAGILAYYSKKTYDDTRTLYAEAVGYELGKKPEEVDWRDIFFKSRNTALRVTADALAKRTLLRTMPIAAFLAPWHKLRGWQEFEPKYIANLNAGVGAVGMYLSADGFVRSQTFFEAEQKLADGALNHADETTHEVVRPRDIRLLMLLQRRHLNKHYQAPKLNSPEGENDNRLGSRIADLLNQTYDNIPRTEPANFTIGKFNYLVGFGMLGPYPESLAFVELANKSSDMKEVNAAAAAIKGGQDPQAVFKSFGIDMQNLVEKSTALALGTEPVPGKFTAAVTPAEDKTPAARSLMDYATKKADEPNLNLSA